MTPFTKSLSSMSDQLSSFVRDDVDPLLRAELERAIQGPVSVEDFVKQVWGFDPESISEDPLVSAELLQAYTRNDQGGRLEERHRYQPLLNIFTKLLQQHAGTSSAIDASWKILAKRSVVSKYLDIKPDLAYVTHDRNPLSWASLLVPVEVKVIDKSHSVVTPSDSSQPLAGRKRSKESHDEAEYVPGQSKKLRTSKKTSAASSATSSRSGSQTLGPVPPASAPGSSSATANDKRFTNHQYQLGSYLQESMANAVRSWASGALIEDYLVQLWYADRMGLVHATQFNFQRQPRQLLIVLSAIRSCNLHGLGYHRSIILRDPQPPSLVDLEGATLTLTAPLDINGHVMPNDSPLMLKIKEKTPRFIQYGLVARGTTILAVESPEIWGSGRTLIAKVGWPVKSRTAEDQFIREIYKALRGSPWLEHIVDMKCSQTSDWKDMKLPRSSFEQLDGFEIEERVCRTLLFEEYLPLQQVETVEEFKSVFLSIVRGAIVIRFV
jgi:hypothetical protein